MPNIERLIDLSSYKRVLPYDSELFGVYQPMIGWKSRRKIVRIGSGVQLEHSQIQSRLTLEMRERIWSSPRVGYVIVPAHHGRQLNIAA
jgi:hypothetical protein